MQLARGFMLLAATGRKPNLQHFHGLIEENFLLVHLKGDNHIQNFQSGEVFRRKYIWKSCFTAQLAHHLLTKFQYVYQTIYLPK